jgi:hypothetical protein
MFSMIISFHFTSGGRGRGCERNHFSGSEEMKGDMAEVKNGNGKVCTGESSFHRKENSRRSTMGIVSARAVPRMGWPTTLHCMVDGHAWKDYG